MNVYHNDVNPNGLIPKIIYMINYSLKTILLIQKRDDTNSYVKKGVWKMKNEPSKE